LSLWTIIRRSLAYYWRSDLAVVFGVTVAAAVLVGSLSVGDSVEGSLHDLALERLGRVSYALSSDMFVREQLAADLMEKPRFRTSFDLSVPAIIAQGTVRRVSSGPVTPGVRILGVQGVFWQFDGDETPGELEGRQIVINRNLAEDLRVAEGDTVLLTLGQRGAAPAATIFGRRSARHTVLTMRLVVGGVIPARGLGIFGLRGDQARPRNLYLSLPWLQRQLGREGRVNTILVGSSASNGAGDDVIALQEALSSAARLEDCGLRLSISREQGYLSLKGIRLVVAQRAVVAAAQAARNVGFRAAVTSVYLANSLRLADREGEQQAVSYSVVAGLDPMGTPPLAALPMVDGGEPPSLADDEILLNAWAADDLGAEAGDTIEMEYFVSLRTGRLETRTRRFKLRGIVAMEGAALDRGLVPDFEGMTGAATMGDWDPPFPIDMDRIRPRDEQYWAKYRTVPKAFISLAAARELWLGTESSGTDWVTSVRIAPPRGTDLDEAARVLADQFLSLGTPRDYGLTFEPVRQQALEAAKGSTDFGVLFLSMSMFLVAAAAGLAGLLLRLTVERRARQAGILLATGFTPSYVRRVLMYEGSILALAGILIGTPLGVGYAQLIIHALSTWWRGAVGGFALSLHVRGQSLFIGAVAAFTVSQAAIWWGLRVLRRTRAVILLGGWQAIGARPSAARRRRALWMGAAALALGAFLLVLSGVFGLVSTTGAFFGGGASLLVGMMGLLCGYLQRRGGGRTGQVMSLGGLARRGAARNWLRSLLTVGLVGCATFIIVAVAANRKDPSQLDTRRKDSGAGGFNLMARSDLPVYVDLGSREGRRQLGFSPESSETLQAARIVSFRMSAGDDISCLNIQRPSTPRVLGVPHELIERGGFDFSKILTEEAPANGSPWRLLEAGSNQDDPAAAVPAIAEAASAQWILKTGLGGEVQVPGQSGGNVRLHIVGLLANSVFAGELLISEEQFIHHFGADTGYRYFLIRTPPEQEEAVGRALRDQLGPLGFDVIRTADALARYAQVQNTYLATFQTLGGLGLLLGTFGVVTVLLRGVVERRNELAMMLALGFRRLQLVAMVMLENGLLMFLGVVMGSTAALVAVAPHLLSTQADVRWLSLAGILVSCLLVGLLFCLIAAAASVRGQLVAALRSE